MKPSLRQLEYVAAIGRHGSFSKAARACGVTQPGLSAQVRRLEETLGVALFERKPREVIVTHAGRRVIELAEGVLAGVDELLATAQTLQDPLRGTVRLGVIPTIAPYLLPAVMPSIRARYPDLRLLLKEERTETLVAEIAAGELDLALVALESDLGDLATFPLFRDPFVLAVSTSHRLRGRKRVRPDDLKGEEVLLLDDGHCLRDQTSAICDAAGACELGDFRATSLSTLVQMVQHGVGVTLLPAMAVAGDPSVRSDIHVIPFNHPEPGRTVALTWRATSPLRERFVAFARGLASVAAPPGTGLA